MEEVGGDQSIETLGRPEPIMLLKLPIMILSNAPKFPLLCSNIPQLCPIMLQIYSYKLCLDCSIRVSNASMNILLACGDCSNRVYQSLTNLFFTMYL